MEAAVGISLIGTALGSYGMLQGGKNAKQAAKDNAQTALLEGKLIRDSAVEDERIIREKGRRVMGAAKAQIGASGFAETGSFIDVLNDSARQVELDVENTKFNKNMAALSKELEAYTGIRQGDAQERASGIGATGNLLVGGANAYTSYKRGTASNQFSLGGGSVQS